MRYYSIAITDPANGNVVIPGSLGGTGNGQTSYTSFVNGKTLPGAQNVELNVPSTVYDQPLGAAFVRIWGVSLAEIGQATDLLGKRIAVYAGMQKGLPLAKPDQAGLILQGFINQSLGNWIETAMTLDLVVAAGTGSAGEPKNIVHVWKKGTKLADAIRQTLSTAFPSYTADVRISDDLVLGEDDVGYYQSIEQYAAYVRAASVAVKNQKGYQGVRVALKETKFSVFDATSPASPTQIAFEDMIGQPTWIEPLTMQFKTAMRADLSVGDYVKMPPAIVTTQQGGAAPFGSSIRQSSVFQGSFLIKQMTHFGNYRQPDAASWNTTFNCAAVDVK